MKTWGTKEWVLVILAAFAVLEIAFAFFAADYVWKRIVEISKDVLLPLFGGVVLAVAGNVAVDKFTGKSTPPGTAPGNSKEPAA